MRLLRQKTTRSGKRVVCAPPLGYSGLGLVPVVLLVVGGMGAGAMLGREMATSLEELHDYIMRDDEDERWT